MIEENAFIIELVYKYYNIFVDGMGGINASGISLILGVEDVPKKIQSIYLQKIIYYTTVSLQIRDKEENPTFEDNKNGKKC